MRHEPAENIIPFMVYIPPSLSLCFQPSNSSTAYVAAANSANYAAMAAADARSTYLMQVRECLTRD